MKNIVTEEGFVGTKKVFIHNATTNKSIMVNYCDKLSARDVAERFTSVGPLSSYMIKYIRDIYDPESINRIIVDFNMIINDHNITTEKIKGVVIKAYYKEAGDELGCSCNKFASMLNGAIVRAYITPNKMFIDRFATTWRFNLEKKRREPVRNGTCVLMVNNNASLGYEYIKDNMDHLAGFGVVFGWNAAKAKSIMGKNLWRRLCHNSKSRNDMIINTANLLSFEGDGHKKVHILESIPSTILGRATNVLAHLCDVEYRLGVQNVTRKVINYFNRPLHKICGDDIIGVTNNIVDVNRMCEQSGKAFNPAWSITRMLAEHNNLIKAVVLKDASKDDFVVTKFLQNEYIDDKFKATLIKSEYDLKGLGVEQKHCVGSYAFPCNRLEYAVYTITDDTGLISTLGISAPWGKSGHTQHYHALNKQVTDETRIAFGKLITWKVIDKFKEIPEEIRFVAPEPPVFHPVALEAPAVEIEEDFNYDLNEILF